MKKSDSYRLDDICPLVPRHFVSRDPPIYTAPLDLGEQSATAGMLLPQFRPLLCHNQQDKLFRFVDRHSLVFLLVQG
jgi:hypothetical protein